MICSVFTVMWLYLCLVCGFLVHSFLIVKLFGLALGFGVMTVFISCPERHCFRFVLKLYISSLTLGSDFYFSSVFGDCFKSFTVLVSCFLVPFIVICVSMVTVFGSFYSLWETLCGMVPNH